MSDQLIPQSVLLNNLSTIKSIADAVRGTFGPKGLDVMMIDQYGDFTITNDGVQILSLIETSHPAAKILIDAAKTQEEQVGDGTTTVTLLTEALLSEAVKQVEKGVPIPKLIEGIKVALKKTEEDLKEISIPIQDLNDSKLASVALISGRGEKELVDLILQAAKTIGCEKLKNPNFKFAKTIISKSQTESQLIKGIILNKSRLNSSMPFELKAAKVLVIDDALAPEDLPQEAIGTEKGFAQFQQIQANFLQGIKKIIDLGVKLVLVDSNIHPYAEELFVEAGIIAVQRIASSEIQRAIQYTGAKPISRRGLNLA
jgi:chaperonin GroEL (HSP60 family)